MEGKAREKPAGRETRPHMPPFIVSTSPKDEGGLTFSGDISQFRRGLWQADRRHSLLEGPRCGGMVLHSPTVLLCFFLRFPVRRGYSSFWGVTDPVGGIAIALRRVLQP